MSMEIENGPDYLVSDSHCRWCGTGNVTVDSEWHMCGDCADRARSDREGDYPDADMVIGPEEGKE